MDILNLITRLVKKEGRSKGEIPSSNDSFNKFVYFFFSLWTIYHGTNFPKPMHVLKDISKSKC